ncbi:unnamed protein product [Chironomus riparius]|uniref:Elongation of very long chain fatty acids protein n=1 Tax=Chironomus riparius TaxID=315576 RepID=A0A9N9RLV0_9DIPT|nr:unnamed protein product [Chironomus riparius]
MEVINKMQGIWYNLMNNMSDQRVANWPLMSSPIPTIMICFSYVYIVKVLGPRFMESRKPYKLRSLIVFYNFLQVLISFYIFYEYASAGWFNDYSWRCQPVDFSRSEFPMRMAEVCWWYYISKFSEFFDTFFFVLRKRYDQVSVLHVIHHGIMPFSVWWGVKFMPGGHSTFFALLNTFIHVIMYTYYMIAAIGPEMQKYLWWKKYLTILQMIQFCGISTHAFQLFVSNPCNYPIVFSYWIGGHGVLFFFLFKNFYKQAYKHNNKLKDDTDINGNAVNGSKFTSINGNDTSSTNGFNQINGISTFNGIKTEFKSSFDILNCGNRKESIESEIIEYKKDL